MKDLGQGGHTQQRHKSHNPREPIILSWRNPKFSLSANQTLPPLFPIIRKKVKSLVQVTNFQKSMAAVLSYCFHFPVFSLLHWLYKVFASPLFVLPTPPIPHQNKDHKLKKKNQEIGKKSKKQKKESEDWIRTSCVTGWTDRCINISVPCSYTEDKWEKCLDEQIPSLHIHKLLECGGGSTVPSCF